MGREILAYVVACYLLCIGEGRRLHNLRDASNFSTSIVARLAQRQQMQFRTGHSMNKKRKRSGPHLEKNVATTRSDPLLMALSLATPTFQDSTKKPSRSVAEASRSAPPQQQFKFNWGSAPTKNDRAISRETWERADAYRPGEKNWFTQQPKDLLDLHKVIKADALKLDVEPTKGIPGSGNSSNNLSLLGTALKYLNIGDLALTLCTDEAPVLKELRDWLVKEFPMAEAVLALPEEQGRVLTTLAVGLDARKMMDLGTFTGYSSIAMALNTADDARVICSEPDKKYSKHAEDWWKKADVTSKMVMHEEGALELMQQMLDNGEARTVDLIFCDVYPNRSLYGLIHEKAMQLLRVGGMIVYYDTLWAADGVLQHDFYPDMRAFNERIARDPRVLAQLVPLSYGITLAMKTMHVDSERLGDAALEDPQDNKQLWKDVLLERRRAVQAELEKIPA